MGITRGTKKKKEREKKRFYVNINMKAQLFVGFLIPIIFVILIGRISYSKAELGMADNYENSVRTAINAQMQYLDLGLSIINSDSVQIKLDSELASLVGGTYKNDASKTAAVHNKTLSSIKVKQTANAFVNNIYIVPKSDNKIIGTSVGSTPASGFFEKWAQTEEGKGFINSKDGEVWVGAHPEMDALTGYPTEEYIMSYVGVFSNRSAVLMVDISAQAVRDSLEGISTDNGEILGFITPDGRELVIKDEENPLEIQFSEQDFFKKCLEAEEMDGSSYVEYDGGKYFFIYSRSEKTGITLVYMVPEENILANARSIKQITRIMVVIACIAALLIGFTISANISVSMSRIIKKLKLAAQGDLTIRFRSGGKDEFSILRKNIMDVIANTRSLIQEVEGIVALVSDAAGDVEKVSVDMEDSSERIIRMIGEIDIGVSQQAIDAGDCVNAMDSLSDSIQSIEADIEQVYANSKKTKEIVGNGISTMEELSEKSVETTTITNQVKADIHKLEEKTAVIDDFVKVINDIAGQTNLLSLNASIEAARVGEAGKGFAVVAEEIRKLADGSLKAAQEIQKVVEEINRQTIETVSVANKAEAVVSAQAGIVGRTKEDFTEISGCTEQLIANIRKIRQNIEQMDEKREGTLGAIASISAASEQTASSSSGVHEIAKGQKNVVDALKAASNKLKLKMSDLEKALALFMVEEEKEKK